MPLDAEKRKKIAELLAKGWTYRRIQKELGVSSKHVAEVSKDRKEEAISHARELEYPPKIREKIVKLKAKKDIEQLELEIAKVRAQREKMEAPNSELLDRIILILAQFLGDLETFGFELKFPASSIVENALNKGLKGLIAIVKSHRPELLKAVVERLVKSLGISTKEFLDPKEGWFTDYGITLEDLKKHGLIH